MVSGVENISSRNFVGLTNDDIKDSIGDPDLELYYIKSKFYLSLHYSGDKSYLFVNKSVICKFKKHNYIPWFEFCLGSASKDFTFNIHVLDLIFMNI